MRDVIQKLITAEAEAKRLIQAAKADAQRILSEAQQQAQKLTFDTRQEAQLAAQRILTTAITNAEADKQARLATFVVEIEKQIDLNESKRRQVVEAVVRCVCS